MAAVMAELGEKPFRAKQLYRWLHAKRAGSFEEMTDLPAALRQKLGERYSIDSAAVALQRTSRDGTRKLLYRLADGHCVEAVVMRYHHGLSLCISSQVGCRMGCRFGASAVGVKGAAGGLVRNLRAGEMLAEVYTAEAVMGERIGHLVLMGIGEPLDNFDEVMDFIEILTSEDGYNMSGRAISLSTCGMVPAIYRLAEKRLGLTLSVSLHAANDAARSSMMPVNDVWPLEKLIKAARDYQDTTGRRVSFEYAMVRGVNDTAADAAQLAGLLAGMGAHVNLIPTNPVDGSGFSASDTRHVEAFAARLNRLGLSATVRRRLGADIDAACGQLRLQRAAEEDKA